MRVGNRREGRLGRFEQQDIDHSRYSHLVGYQLLNLNWYLPSVVLQTSVEIFNSIPPAACLELP